MVANDGWRIRLQRRLYDVMNINQDDCMALEEASMNQEVAEKEAEGEEDFLRRRQHVVASGDHRTKPKSADVAFGLSIHFLALTNLGPPK